MFISLKKKSDQQATQGQAHSFVYWSCARADSVCKWQKERESDLGRCISASCFFNVSLLTPLPAHLLQAFHRTFCFYCFSHTPPPESAVQFFEWRQPGARLKQMLKCYYSLFLLMFMSKNTLSFINCLKWPVQRLQLK